MRRRACSEQAVASKEKPAASEPTEGMLVTTNVRLVRPLGEGGMGSVWVADHLSLRTQVVVKFMANELAKSPEATALFSREAAAASQVKSPHVVQMLDHGVSPDGAPYIVMELLEGRDLDQHLHSATRLKPTEAVAVLAQLARALEGARARDHSPRHQAEQRVPLRCRQRGALREVARLRDRQGARGGHR